MKNMKNTNVTRLLIPIGVFLLIIGGLLSFLEDDQLKNDTATATATVVEYTEDSQLIAKHYETIYYPVVTYDVDGESIRSQYTEYFEDQPYEVGQTIDIKYDPKNPEEFIISDDKSHFNGKWTVVAVIGAIMIIVGIGRIFMKKKR